ncbi:hypothetical protein S40288_03776 [Stachybotrys chartarum IBT 40288]|nr:hypothetical protein S40288_03776 [Stachybotrys chartarum IBT 40288]
MAEQWYCKPCHLLFPTEEALKVHREEQRREGVSQHILCNKCGEQLVDTQHEFAHLQKCHGKDQGLWCPCGDGPYARLGDFMAHIEQGWCGMLNLARLDQMRDEKQKFTQQLREITNQPIKNDFWSFVIPSHEFNSQGDFTHQQQLNAEHNRKAEQSNWHGMEEETSTPKSTSCSGPTLYDLDQNDPSHPGFNIANYWHPTTDKYRCPKAGCGKGFPRPRAFMAHLRGPAHSNRSYRCPWCQRSWKSLQAIASHVETSDVRCRLRDSASFGVYIDQLTAGLVEPLSSRHDDGSVKYKIGREGLQRLRQMIGGVPGHAVYDDKKNAK